MPTTTEKRPKTFPLELEDSLHKALKMIAIHEDKSLHSLIIETLAARVSKTATSNNSRKAKQP